MSHHHDDGRRFTVERLLGAEERRRPVIPPESLLEEFLPRDDLTLADVGAGIGFFAIPAGRHLSSGRVIAVDPEPDLLALLQKRAREAGLQNVETVQAGASHMPLPDGAVDVALMSLVFHDIEAEDREDALKDIRRILRPGGTLYLIEREAHPFPSKDLPAVIERGGFITEEVLTGPDPFYRLLAKKP